MQKPSLETDLLASLVGLLVMRVAGCEERPAGIDPIPKWPLNAASYPPVRGPHDMLSSPLEKHILDYEPPREFVILSFAMYDSFSDPYDHMLHYNQAMILNAGNDKLLCKVFPASLKGPTLAWFHKLPRGSLNSFDKL